MEPAQPLTFRDLIFPAGFRKMIALLILSFATVLPPLVSWQDQSAAPAQRSALSGRYAPRGGFLGDRHSPEPTLLSRLATAARHSLVLIACTIALVLYCPRRGFKRYALICGPLLAILIPLGIGIYMQGRQQVFRFEIMLVTLASALPAAALYAALVWRKCKRLGIPW